MPVLDWYFDYISPFAYLQFYRLAELPKTITVRPKPVLFAGFLNHWGHRGPAEIPKKRQWTYRHAQWLGRRMDQPLTVPSNHPFNPIKALRLTVALGNEPQVIQTLFEAVWQRGELPDHPEGWQRMVAACGLKVAQAAELIGDQAVKEQLKTNGEEAVAAGAFGVPTAIYQGELFWGVDGTDFLLDFVQHPDLFKQPEMLALETITPSAVRPQSQ